MERLNPWRAKEAPPFDQLLLFWNCEVERDGGPFIDGWLLDNIIVEIEAQQDHDASAWFIEHEGAVLAEE